MNLIKVEIEQLKHQIELLDAIYTEQSAKISYCDSLKNLCKYYLNYGKENFLHKLGYSKGKEE